MTARSGPVVVVVGARGAIGRAVVTDLKRDHQVVAADVTPVGAPARAVVQAEVDVRDEASVRALRDRVRAELGRVDALVYCAGVLPRGTLRVAGVRGWQEAFDVNVLGAVRCIRVFAELMARGATGRIVLLGSLSARAALPGAAAYAASKAALESLARSAAAELAPSGIAVMCISPGYVASEMTRGVEGRADDTPLGRMAKPDEIAEVVRAVLSVQSAYMTGARIEIGGGLPT